MVLRPRVQFKSIECDPLHPDRDLGEVRPDLGVEAVAVHAEIAGGVAESDESGEDFHGGSA
jgi:hypothetical protein